MAIPKDPLEATPTGIVAITVLVAVDDRDRVGVGAITIIRHVDAGLSPCRCGA